MGAMDNPQLVDLYRKCARYGFDCVDAEYVSMSEVKYDASEHSPMNMYVKTPWFFKGDPIYAAVVVDKGQHEGNLGLSPATIKEFQVHLGGDSKCVASLDTLWRNDPSMEVVHSITNNAIPRDKMERRVKVFCRVAAEFPHCAMFEERLEGKLALARSRGFDDRPTIHEYLHDYLGSWEESFRDFPNNIVVGKIKQIPDLEIARRSVGDYTEEDVRYICDHYYKDVHWDMEPDMRGGWVRTKPKEKKSVFDFGKVVKAASPAKNLLNRLKGKDDEKSGEGTFIVKPVSLADIPPLDDGDFGGSGFGH